MRPLGRITARLVPLALFLLSASVHAVDVVEYYHTDGIGNVRVVTDATGSVIERHDYLPFGEEWCGTAVCGANRTPGQPRRFTGKERDAETGLDYFGARYYRANTGRFTTVDPVMNAKANLPNPQRWNRYAHANNSPLRYIDPDGREVIYANDNLRVFFSFLSDRSGMVRDTLGLYTGAGKPDIFITHADAGKEPDGKDRNGAFSTSSGNYSVDYSGKESQLQPGMKREQLEDLGVWTLVGKTTLTLDQSLTISVLNQNTIGTALHELGHADHAARTPLEYMRQSEKKTDASGKLVPWEKRSVEKTAEGYRTLAKKEVGP